MAVDTLATDGLPRFVWEDIPVVDRDYVRVVMASVKEAHRWRREYATAKAQVAARASPDAA
jgi:hypothetical protein